MYLNDDGVLLIRLMCCKLELESDYSSITAVNFIKRAGNEAGSKAEMSYLHLSSKSIAIIEKQRQKKSNFSSKINTAHTIHKISCDTAYFATTHTHTHIHKYAHTPTHIHTCACRQTHTHTPLNYTLLNLNLKKKENKAEPQDL